MRTHPGKGWSWRHRDGIDYLVLEVLEKTGLVRHGFSGRKGGISKSNYASLNLGLHVGDDPKAVLQNRQQFAKILGVSSEKIVVPAQVHSDQIEVVGQQHQGLGAQDLDSAIPGADALVTQEPGLSLCTYYADCVPIFILDPIRPAIGLAHAGWKGTALKIAVKTLQRMKGAFDTNPGDCLVGIGPSIGPCCYEVDVPVLHKFIAAYPGEKIFSGKVTREIAENQIWLNPKERVKLNLWEANRQALLEVGVKPEHIWTAGLCTRCHLDSFFSYRGVNGKSTGRMGAIISLIHD